MRLLCRNEAWHALDEAQQLGALKHEALHLVLGHLLLRPDYADKGRFDRAADLVANQYLAPTQRCPGAITLEQVNAWRAELGRPALEAQRELAYYYRLLPPSGGEGRGAGEGLARAGHDNWAAFAQLPEARRSLLDQQLQGRLEQAALRAELEGSGRGLLPGAVLAAVEQLLARRRPSLNWRRALRLFAASSRRTSVRNTLRRPSKRYGTTPGTRIQPHQRLLVAVDTSASIDDAQLSAFFAEINHLWRAGAEIILVECDTAIQRSYSYCGTAPQGVQGRGGTDFTAPVEYANRHRFDGIVYFTDGQAPPPAVRPRVPLLWLLHGDAGDADRSRLTSCGRVIPMAADQ
ncbi:VWA-like domain-containing protein [Microbulbifer taiwanensis]|uniref:vWA domain-containing protein n=1 Tax=Microbulbifer taiwanensis TaxID=986746 RepID=UPI003618AE19